MPKSSQMDQDDRSEVVDIKTDSDSEPDANQVKEPPLKKMNSSASSSNMPSRKKKSKEKETVPKEDEASTQELLTPEVLKELLNKITRCPGSNRPVANIRNLDFKKKNFKIRHPELHGSAFP